MKTLAHVSFFCFYRDYDVYSSEINMGKNTRLYNMHYKVLPRFPRFSCKQCVHGTSMEPIILRTLYRTSGLSRWHDFWTNKKTQHQQVNELKKFIHHAYYNCKQMPNLWKDIGGNMKLGYRITSVGFRNCVIMSYFNTLIDLFPVPFKEKGTA